MVEVNDTGLGIEPEAIPRIFNAFEHGGTLDHAGQFGGLGLGLTISKALVEMHGGTIEADSEGRDKGATFRIRLPLTGLGQPEAPAGCAAVAGPTFRILWSRTTASRPDMLRMVLAADGHGVAMAGDVTTALELADQGAFDLLISDLGLPDGSGHDLMRLLRQRGHTPPGIALSGYGQEEDIQRSREAGFAAHLTKPASRELLVEAIAAVTTG